MRMFTQITRRAKDTGTRRGVLTEVRVLTRENAVALSPRIIGAIEESVQTLGCPYRKMTSGAMHDAAHMARITDVGMVFIPCQGGVSHSPDENAEPKDIEAGAKVLERTVLRLAND